MTLKLPRVGNVLASGPSDLTERNNSIVSKYKTLIINDDVLERVSVQSGKDLRQHGVSMHRVGVDESGDIKYEHVPYDDAHLRP